MEWWNGKAEGPVGQVSCGMFFLGSSGCAWHHLALNASIQNDVQSIPHAWNVVLLVPVPPIPSRMHACCQWPSWSMTVVSCELWDRPLSPETFDPEMGIPRVENDRDAPRSGECHTYIAISPKVSTAIHHHQRRLTYRLPMAKSAAS